MEEQDSLISLISQRWIVKIISGDVIPLEKIIHRKHNDFNWKGKGKRS